MSQVPVVLVHGAWFHLSSWERWAEHLSAHGYAVHVPRWPGEAVSAAEGRRRPGPNRDLGLEGLLAHFELFVRSLNSPPVLVGHSLGGLVVQHLFSVGLGCAAVALAPWPGNGGIGADMRTGSWSLGSDDATGYEGFAQLPWSRFRHAVANTVDEDEATQLFERHVVPAPRRLLADVGFEDSGGRGGATEPVRIVVDTADAERGPLLLVSGQEDRVVPDSVTRTVYKSYGDCAAVTDLKQFADRGHSLVIDSGWRTIADYVIGWLVANGITATTGE